MSHFFTRSPIDSVLLLMLCMQVAIAISLASFIVGALSTGVLWFIHSRALRAKSVRLSSCSYQMTMMITSQHLAAIVIIGILSYNIENEWMIQEQLRIACEGTELVGLSPATNNHTSNGTAIGADHHHIMQY